MTPFERAQRGYDAEVPEDDEEVAEREARKRARDERKIDDYVFGEK